MKFATTGAARRALTVCAAALFVAVGCGEGSSNSTRASSSTQSASATATDDAATAQKLMWTAADFPSDWTSAPHHKSADYKETGDRLAACAGGVNVQAPVDVDAPDFSNDTLEAGLGIAIQADTATVAADFTAISGPKFADCSKAEIIRALGTTAQSPNVTVEVTQGSPPSGTPPSTVVLRATITRDGTVLVVSDVVLMGAGRTELTLTFTGKGAAFPDPQAAELITAAVARLSANPT